MRPSMILAVARAEMRSVRRLIRYWMFVIVSVLASFLIYAYYAALHGFLSRLSATIGAIGPRYLVNAMGIYILAIFLLGLIFLAFDVRARDERERMAEVLDSRPLSNTELLLGRTLGLVLMAWLPVLFVALGFQAVGSLALMFGWYMGEPVEPYSLAGFTLHALAVFASWCLVVVVLAVLVRNRLLVALAALAVVGLQLWGIFSLPLYLQPIIGALFPDAPTASDFVPVLATGQGSLRLAALFVLASGLLALAAAFHPRSDGGSKRRRIALGAGLVALGGLMIGAVAWRILGDIDRRVAWLEAHQARRADDRADVQAITGSVRIDPGRQVDLDLELRVQAPPDRRLGTLLFTFNPGFVVERVTTGGMESAWTHASGLLEITPAGALAPGEQTTIELVASGRPDITFGYLDSSVDLINGTVGDANLALLGIESGVFRRGYVALMPGQGWLPHAGSFVPASDPRSHPADHFEIDLEVEVPEDWLVAGPGRRQVVEGGDAARFRFNPGAPVTEVGLLASRFDRRAMEVGGVEFEILVHPRHDRNLRFFADAASEITTRVETLFADAKRLGLPYPYGGLTLVESPTGLRGYGGGWRMDTTQSMPGVLLLRENSFPTARFEFEFRNPRQFEDRDGGIARAKLEAIERFFENDFSGGNVFLGGSRNFLLFQTGARGEGALAVNFVVDELVNLLLTGKRGYFSAFMFDSRLSTGGINPIVAEVVSGRTDSIAQAVLNSAADRPSVWDRALGASLADLEPTDNPEQSLNVLALKSRAIARSIVDGLGREKTGALLAELLRRHRGGHFTAADFHQVAIDLGSDLKPVIGDWLHEASLPGFITSPVVVERLTDDAQGNPRYQTRVHVFNGETTPGLLRLRYTSDENAAPGAPAGGREGGPVLVSRAGASRWDQTEPVRLAGLETMEIGVLSARPLRELWLQPYLSLNRHDIRMTLPRLDRETQVRAEPFLGARSSDWRPPKADEIVIDDLDPGFSVEKDQGQEGVRLGGGLASFVPQADMDEGLPAPPVDATLREWSRREAPLGWGKYRHTVAMVTSGPGAQRAVFTADLPSSGRWRLATHLPAGVLAALGTYDLTLIAGGQERTLEFDGAAAEAGWNVLGEFDLREGETRVTLSDKSSGGLVVADAVRWQPVSGAQ